MKKILLGLATILATSAAFAQPNKVISAQGYLRNGDLLKAKENIDLAAKHPKTENNAKALLYRAKIYTQLATAEGEQYAPYKDGSALIEAANAYKKIKTLDEKSQKKIDIKQVDQKYQFLASGAFQQAIDDYNAKNYTNAAKMFALSAEIKEQFGQIDTTAVYNSALSEEKSGNVEAAIKGFRKCMDLGYKGGRVYYDVAKLQQESGDVDGALKTLNEGLSKYPGDQTLLTSSINIYLKEDKVDEALANLNSAIENEPNNGSYYFARGTLFDKKGDMEKAEADYKTAIDLNPDSYDANYNLGALYVNKSGAVQEEMNALSFSEQKKYDELKVKRDELFAKSIPFLEKALEAKPDDKLVQNTLMELYGKTGQNEKYTEMKKKLTGQ